MADTDDTNPLSVPLFDGYDEPITPQQAQKLSPDRRRTLTQKTKINNGIHPANGLRVVDNGETCGSCAHAAHLTYHTRSYIKCDLGSMSHSAASDIRAWWPACPQWEAIDS